jgi:elongation factor P--beta-lysine ligase
VIELNTLLLTYLIQRILTSSKLLLYRYRDADKSLARPERKQATATEDFEFHISYL